MGLVQGGHGDMVRFGEAFFLLRVDILGPDVDILVALVGIEGEESRHLRSQEFRLPYLGTSVHLGVKGPQAQDVARGHGVDNHQLARMAGVVAQDGRHQRRLGGRGDGGERHGGGIDIHIGRALAGRAGRAVTRLVHLPGDGEGHAAHGGGHGPGEVELGHIARRAGLERDLHFLLAGGNRHVGVATVAFQHHFTIDTLVEPYLGIVAAHILRVIVQEHLLVTALRGNIDVSIVNPAVVACVIVDRHLDVQLVHTGRGHEIESGVLILVGQCSLRKG